jgi:hypothetical protein
MLLVTRQITIVLISTLDEPGSDLPFFKRKLTRSMVSNVLPEKTMTAAKKKLAALTHQQ